MQEVLYGCEKGKIKEHMSKKSNQRTHVKNKEHAEKKNNQRTHIKKRTIKEHKCKNPKNKCKKGKIKEHMSNINNLEMRSENVAVYKNRRNNAEYVFHHNSITVLTCVPSQVSLPCTQRT